VLNPASDYRLSGTWKKRRSKRRGLYFLRHCEDNNPQEPQIAPGLRSLKPGYLLKNGTPPGCKQ
jgi:hypothetical protein